MAAGGHVEHGLKVHHPGAAEQQQRRTGLHGLEGAAPQKALVLRGDAGHHKYHFAAAQDVVERGCGAAVGGDEFGGQPRVKGPDVRRKGCEQRHDGAAQIAKADETHVLAA